MEKYKEGNSAQAQHYIGARMEPIEVMQALMPPLMFQGFLLGNTIKYSMRVKNPESDPVKAKQYDVWLYLARRGVTIKPLVHVCPDHPYGLMYQLPVTEQEELYTRICDYQAEVECAERCKNTAVAPASKAVACAKRSKNPYTASDRVTAADDEDSRPINILETMSRHKLASLISQYEDEGLTDRVYYAKMTEVYARRFPDEREVPFLDATPEAMRISTGSALDEMAERSR